MQYLIFPSKVVAYERATDQVAILKGGRAGLISYRKLLYTQLTAEEVAVKKERYMTPEEIEYYSSALGGEKENLDQASKGETNNFPLIESLFNL